MKVLSRALAATTVLAAAGCTNLIGGSLGDTFAMDSFLASDPGGSGFNGALADAYQDLAALNASSDVNFLDSTVYKQKSMAAAAGSPMPLFSPADYGVNGDLEALRGIVMNAAGEHAGVRPEECAEMYAMYDRLVEATYQDHGPGTRVGLDPEEARANYDAAYTACVGIQEMVVYFGFGSSALTAAAESVIADISANVVPSDAVSVVGHTDTVGSQSFNQQLSERRARNVAGRMSDLGVDPAQITVAGRSFNEPAVETGPNVREPLNRRVEIDISR
jgi:outer membrane protein OmpA-like peptidoglycan-associated protein